MSNLLENYQDIRKHRKYAASVSQRKAADPANSVWVEASAGTGKTKVLSDRVLRLLLNGVNPSRILCLTYTKAAAVEMKTRISKRLSEWAVEDEEKLHSHIEELLGINTINNKYMERARTLFAILLDTPGGIKIQTIHSFAEEILKRFPLEAGISPYFEILDERMSSDALQHIQNEMLRGEQKADVSREDAAVQYLASRLGEKNFPKVMSSITENRSKISDSLKMYGGLEGLLDVLQKSLNVHPQDSEEDIKREFMSSINKEEITLNIAALTTNSVRDSKKAQSFAKIQSSAFSIDDYNEYKRNFLKADGEMLSDEWLATGQAQKKDIQVLQRMRDEALRILETENKCRKIRLYASSQSFLIIACRLIEKYDEYKRAKSCLDYEDLINLACALLADTSRAAWVLYKLDGGIDHILLDEAQDTSPQQWDIIKALSEEFFSGLGESEIKRTVFAVGDRKQSIFSFQGADPQKFDMMSDYFSRRGGASFNKISLEASFRSTPAVLESVNKIFADANVASGVISPDSPVEHIPVRAGEYGRVEIWPLEVAEKNEKTVDEDSLLPPVEMTKRVSVCTRMAQKIAAKIKQMVETSQTDENNDNPLHYKDFMVLVRHRNTFVEEFIRACKEQHVNISGADKMILSEQIAVQDLISLGKFLLLPNDDLSLAEVLKSPLFGLTDQDLEELCCERNGVFLWVRLGDNPKYASVYQRLQNLFNMLDYIRPYELFNYVLVNMDGRRKFINRMGNEVEDALDEFMNIVLSFEQFETPSLQGFISWFEHDETALKRDIDDSENDAVRLMTVHHSKGLQAKIVFLPDTVQLPGSIRSGMGYLRGEDNIILYPLCKDDYDDNCKRIKEKDKISALEEYRRLLYVALTRAEEQLFVCGYSNSDNISNDSWMSICHSSLKKGQQESSSGQSLVYESPAMIEQTSDKKYFIPSFNIEPQSWIFSDAMEETALAKPYTPSKDDDEEADSASPLADSGDFYRRGSLIHKILQFLPENSADKAKIIDEYMQNNAIDFSERERLIIKNEILKLLQKEECADLFMAESKAEVPVFGVVEGKIISAQIDRLVVLPDKIKIVDFKTNRPAAKNIEDTPEIYRRQLETYRKLIQQIYPHRKVETYILWTNEARLMRVS